jgi:hypothetical protein
MDTWVIPEGWNDATVALIPKVDDPKLITQFRPISLCKVIYKIISNMLAIWLKEILPEVISPMQSAFVPTRLIIDNVLIAYESVLSIEIKRSGNVGCCALKLDMCKAYDRVEWVFPWKHDAETGFWWEMDFSNDGMCPFGEVSSEI